MKAFEMWLDGDNFLGIAVAENEERAIEITPSYFKKGIVSCETTVLEDKHLREEWFFTQSEDIVKLGFGDRLMFKITGLFMIAKKAHRLLYYILD